MGPTCSLLGIVVGIRATASSQRAQPYDHTNQNLTTWVFQPQFNGSNLDFTRGGYNLSGSGIFEAVWVRAQDGLIYSTNLTTPTDTWGEMVVRTRIDRKTGDKVQVKVSTDEQQQEPDPMLTRISEPPDFMHIGHVGGDTLYINLQY